MVKIIRNVFRTETLLLVEANDGYYLYDYIEGQNISMRAKTEQDAYIEAMQWYQKRLASTRADYKTLWTKVDNFLGQFQTED